MEKTPHFSPNFSSKSRLKSKIKFVIIHYTGMQSEIESIRRLKNPNSRVSCHYLINRKVKSFKWLMIIKLLGMLENLSGKVLKFKPFFNRHRISQQRKKIRLRDLSEISNKKFNKLM